MLQILAISAFPEINYEFVILGQSSRTFLRKVEINWERSKKVRKGRKMLDYLQACKYAAVDICVNRREPISQMHK